jgi:hypothetical protein
MVWDNTPHKEFDLSLLILQSKTALTSPYQKHSSCVSCSDLYNYLVFLIFMSPEILSNHEKKLRLPFWNHLYHFYIICKGILHA